MASLEQACFCSETLMLGHTLQLQRVTGPDGAAWSCSQTTEDERKL